MSSAAAPNHLQHSYSSGSRTGVTKSTQESAFHPEKRTTVQFHQSQYALDDEEEDEEEQRRLGNRNRGMTPEGYYEDIYKQYTQMDDSAAHHDSAMPYTNILRQGSESATTKATAMAGMVGSGTGTRRRNSAQDLQRNQSKTSKTSSSISRLGSLFGRGKTSQSISETTQSRHTRGVGSTTLPLSSPASRSFGWFPRTWAARLFLLATLAEAAADISIEAVLLSRFRELQGGLSVGTGNLSALPVFLMVFGMAHVYQCFLAVDSIVNRNTILVFGLVLFNLAFLVYALIQIEEIRGVLGNGVIPGTSQTVPVQILTGAIPVIIGITSLVLAILAYFLWKEFGWQIYKTIGADRRLKRAHLHFQIFVCLLKFDFFTFIAYCLQLVLVVLSKSNAEFWITTFSAPVTLVLLVFAWYSVRTELKWGAVVFIIGLWGGAGYFAYKLVRIWEGREGPYKEVYKSLTVFSVLALALGLATFVMTIRCMMNFDMGLKAAMTRSQRERKALKEEEMGPVISAPFQYNLDSPYSERQHGAHASQVDMLDDSVGSPKFIASPSFPYSAGYGAPESQQSYFHSSPSYGQTPPTLPHTTSTQGLLSPTGGNLLPLKNSSNVHLERANSNQHRLSLD